MMETLLFTDARRRVGVMARRPLSRRPPKPKPLSPDEQRVALRVAARRRKAAPTLSVEDLWFFYRTKDIAYPDIDGAVELDLIRYYQAGGEVAKLAADVLVRAHHRGIRHWVFRYANLVKNHDLSHEDLVAEAQIGFLKAVEKFDFREIKLLTYAQHWIHHQIQRACTNHGFAIRIPVWLADQVTDPRVRRVRQVKSLDVFVDENKDVTFLDLIPADGPSPEQDVAAQHRAEKLKVAIAKAFQRLSPKEQLVLRRRVMAKDEPTLEKVGAELGVTRERVRQIEEIAKWKMRCALEHGRALLEIKAAPSDAVGRPRRYLRRLDPLSCEPGPDLSGGASPSQAPTNRAPNDRGQSGADPARRSPPGASPRAA
jgi:RNA polymerase sigma-32 factor